MRLRSLGILQVRAHITSHVIGYLKSIKCRCLTYHAVIEQFPQYSRGSDKVLDDHGDASLGPQFDASQYPCELVIATPQPDINGE